MRDLVTNELEGKLALRIAGIIIGAIAGLFSIGLWVVLVFYHPYTAASPDEAAANTFITLVLPACLAIVASIMKKKYFMLISFVWSLPISLYLALTPGIFAWFIAPCIAYLICFLLMLFPKNNATD